MGGLLGDTFPTRLCVVRVCVSFLGTMDTAEMDSSALASSLANNAKSPSIPNSLPPVPSFNSAVSPVLPTAAAEALPTSEEIKLELDDVTSSYIPDPDLLLGDEMVY